MTLHWKAGDVHIFSLSFKVKDCPFLESSYKANLRICKILQDKTEDILILNPVKGTFWMSCNSHLSPVLTFIILLIQNEMAENGTIVMFISKEYAVPSDWLHSMPTIGWTGSSFFWLYAVHFSTKANYDEYGPVATKIIHVLNVTLSE